MPVSTVKAVDGDFWRPSPESLELAQVPILSSTHTRANPHDTIKANYQQAKAICQAYASGRPDQHPHGGRHDPDWVPVQSCRWHYRPHLNSGIYMLTELGHGLDARNIQTVATMLPSGGFDLHTPTPDAAKSMPVATPISGIEKIAIVFARLQIDGTDHGIRGFIVQLNDGKHMAPGITAKLLPNRAGSSFLDHAITTFNHVQLPKTALLGEAIHPAGTDPEYFSNLIWRCAIGTLSLSMCAIPGLKSSAWIAGQYALKRKVGGTATRKGTPIIQFRTQQLLILHTIAQGSVLTEYAAWSIGRFMDPRVDNRLRHAYAMLFKTVATAESLNSARILSQEVGWRGLFEDNILTRNELESRGNKIAEGDITVLCIRLTSDILHGKIIIPPPLDPKALLSQHEAILLREAASLLQKCGNDFRSPASNRYILPLCQTLVEAIGHRMAYEAARAANIDAALLRLYETGAVKSDLATYVEHSLVTRKEVNVVEDQCVEELLPRLEGLLQDLDVGVYCRAPMLSEEWWEEWLASLETFKGEGIPVNKEGF
ncbi:hypothetical protein BJY04DRAFT_227356 [Aspergillus karnatakaensis]|uniref:uncharacterized protein n=1 Tax=Aspergillus karnatakaensis TaxID=1810916 RepID=UPI003CCCB606